MNNKQEFGKMLNQQEIEVEIAKIKDFFDQIPDELKADAADHFIYEIVNCGSRDHYQALGIFEEAMLRYRETSHQVMAEEAEEERLEAAYVSAQDYRCIQEVDWLDPAIVVGEVCRIGCFGEDDNYSGGKRYEVFHEDKGHVDICQHVLENHFELIEDEK